MSESFFEEMNGVFKEILDTNKNKILIVDSETNLPIEGVKYEKIFLDSELKLYKINDEGKLVPIKNPKVKVVLK